MAKKASPPVKKNTPPRLAAIDVGSNALRMQVAELLPGYFAIGWYGLGAPAGTPTEVVTRLNEASNAAIADPKINARLVELGATPLPGSPADFGKLIADETERWAKVVRFSGAKPN